MTQPEINTLINLQSRGYLLVHDDEQDFPSIVRFIEDPDKEGCFLIADHAGNYLKPDEVEFEDMKVYRREELI